MWDNNKNVLKSARERFRWIFKKREQNVPLSYSNGNDSTVPSNLALEAVRDLNMLPLKVLFLNQYLDAV